MPAIYVGKDRLQALMDTVYVWWSFAEAPKIKNPPPRIREILGMVDEMSGLLFCFESGKWERRFIGREMGRAEQRVADLKEQIQIWWRGASRLRLEVEGVPPRVKRLCAWVCDLSGESFCCETGEWRKPLAPHTPK